MSANRQPYGFLTLTCVVIAGMIGAGIFTTSGFTIAALGSPQRVLIAWLIGGLVAICGAAAYGELARRLPLSGGEYLYLSRNVHPFAGFLAGWVSLTAGFSGAIAFSATTLEAYWLPLSMRPEWLPERTLAIAIVVLCGLGHSFLIRPAALLQNVVVLLKLATLAVFLGLAARVWNVHEWHWQPEQSPTSSGWSVVLAMATSVMWISFSYTGFNSAIYVASEAVNPLRNVPRALLAGTAITTVFYLLLNLVFVTAAPVSEISGQSDVAALAARAIGATPLELVIRSVIGLATLTSVASMIMTGPRVYSRMADDGVFPDFFRTGPDVVSRTVLLQTVLAVMLIWGYDTLRGLLDYLSTTLSLSSAATVATLFLSRRPNSNESVTDEAGQMSSVRASAAACYVLATLSFIILRTVEDPRHLIGTAVTLVVGLILWFIPRKRSS